MIMAIAFIWVYVAGIITVWTLADELGHDKPSLVKMNILFVATPVIALFGALKYLFQKA